MKKYFYALCMATALGTVGCSDDEVINSGDVIDPSLKTSISFSASDGAGGGTSTKALTKADDAGFTAETQIAARFVSKKEGSTDNIRFTRTLLKAKPAEAGLSYSYSKVDFNGEAYNRYWDDAFGRAAQISVYAIAVPGKSDVENGGTILERKLDDNGTKVNDVSNPNWKTAGTENNTMVWTVSPANQSENSIENEDLCYSNNIKEGGQYGRYVWKSGDYPDFKYEANAANPYPNFSDGMLSFQLDDAGKTEGPGHFDKGHMIFKHALTRVTIKLYAGEGFDMTKSPKPFGFTNEPVTPNVILHNMPTSGTLDIKAGTWSNLSNSDINGICLDDDSRISITNENRSDKPAYTLRAQMLPGYTIKEGKTSDYVMSFEIDNNAYYVSQAQIYEALKDKVLPGVTGDITMEQGTHYVLEITVNKTAISNVTATLVNWTEVASERFDADNAYITLSSFIPTDNKSSCEHFDLYRVLTESKSVSSPDHPEFDGTIVPPMKGYVDHEEIQYTADKLSTENSGGITKNSNGSWDGKWKTTWFFESNKTFYYFRTVWPGTKIKGDLSMSDPDYFEMFSGPVNTTGTTISTNIDDDNNHDYHWGAVFKGDISNLKYDPDKGFESQLIGPIGPTKSPINIVEQHMMSKINVVLLTPVDDAGNYLPQSVTLFDNAKTREVSEVNLINFSGSAKVLMGTGKIIPSTDRENKRKVTTPTYTSATDYCETKDYTFAGETQKYYKTKAYTYCVVPQPLVVGAEKVGITIQTPDDNLYYVVEDLSKIKVQNVSRSSVKQDHADDKIERWYPGYSYTYYFVLKKTGIEAITCTIVDWKKVEGGKQDVTLES